MRLNRNWLTVLGIALGLPSVTVSTAYVAYILVKEGLINKYLAFGIFFLILFQMIFLLVWYAKRPKN